MNETRKGRLPLNIQLFAENGGDGSNNDGGSGNGQKTYSEEDYTKLKNSFDKTASELAELKKSFKAKQTDEEKAQEAQKEQADLLAQLQKENQSMKIAKELAVGGYDEKTINSITQDIVNGDMTSLTKTLVALRKTMQEEITKQAQEEFRKTNKLPNGSGSSGEESLGARLGKESAGTNNAREYYSKHNN